MGDLARAKIEVISEAEISEFLSEHRTSGFTPAPAELFVSDAQMH